MGHVVMTKAQIETRITAALDYLLNQFTGLEFSARDWAEAFASTSVVSYEEEWSYYADQRPNQMEAYTAQALEQRTLPEWQALIEYADKATDFLLFG